MTAIPSLILIAGMPGSGKTTLGYAMARRLKACYVDLDTVGYAFIAPHLVAEAGFKDSADYQERFRRLEYDAMLSVAAENVRLGMTAVCSAPFRREISDPRFKEELDSRVGLSYQSVGISISIEKNHLSQNLRERNIERDREKLRSFDSFYGGLREVYASPQWNLDVVIDTRFERGTNWIESVIEGVLSRIGQTL